MGLPELDLAGQRAVVVGGTSGIGLALALGLARAGADVAVAGRRLALAEDAARQITAMGRRGVPAAADVTDRASLEALRQTVEKAFGEVEILLNCAGYTRRRATLDLPREEWQGILDTNLTGTLLACQVFGRGMLERGYGRIINTGSLTSFISMYEVAAYSASKAAVASLTRSLAIEWARRGVTVNAIAPGVFRTDINRELLDGTARGQELLLRTPMGRFGKVEELVGAAVFLASRAAGFVTGHVLAVDGGFLASGVNQ